MNFGLLAIILQLFLTVYYIDVNYLKIYRNGQMEWYVLNKEAKEYLMDQIVTPLFEYGEE